MPLKMFHFLKYRIGPLFATFLEVIVIGAILQHILFRSLSVHLFNWMSILLPQLKYTLFFLVENYIVITTLSILLLWIFGLERGLISKIMCHKYIFFLGKISFCIYMSHQLVFRYIGIWKEYLIGSFGDAVVGITACMIVISISSLMYRFIEVPISRYFMIDRPV
jgi:peptidoglycan/LPS O-acetylase OafA/YrhL